MTSPQKISICLWFTSEAEDAAKLYTSLIPNSHITGKAHYGPGMPMPEGSVMTVTFELAGAKFMGLNGGPAFKANEAVSFVVETEDQAETDRYWDAIVGNGGAESECGWCKDRWGFSWQITPRQLNEGINDPDRAVAKRVFEAMMTMKKIDVATIEAARRHAA